MGENMRSRGNEKEVEEDEVEEGEEYDEDEELQGKDVLQMYFSHLLWLKFEHSFVASDYTERGSGTGLQLIISHLDEYLSAYADCFDDEMSSAFLLWLEGMNIATLVQVVNVLSKIIFGNSSASPCTNNDGEVLALRRKEGSAIFDLFLEVCKMVTCAPGCLMDASFDKHVVNLVHSFVMLGDKELLDKLIDNIVVYTRRFKHFNLVKNLLNSGSTWKALSGLAMGRFSLQTLAKALDTASLCSVVDLRIQSYRSHKLKPDAKHNAEHNDGDIGPKYPVMLVMRCIIIEVCQILVSRDFHHPVQVESELFQHLFLNVFLLGDEKVFYGLAQALLKLEQQPLLEKVLHNDAVANFCAREIWGRDVLQILSLKCVGLLAGSEMAPKFTWSQPNAQLQEHPIMEAFLRGTGESFTYHGFSKLAEARKFALGFFDGCFRNGYCAYGKAGGRGAEAYCVIQKSPIAYLHSWREIKEIAERSRAGAGAVIKRPSAKGPERTERRGAEKRPRVEGSERTKRAEALAAAVKVAVIEGDPAIEQAILDIVNQHRDKKSTAHLGPNLK